jgi:alpha-1,3-mannosyl-glycoprotein beta-1,2-N-acetylglucosaminyltransferase
VDFGTLDLRYLLKDEYEPRFRQWLSDARVVRSIEEARREASSGWGGSGSGDLKVLYNDKGEFVRFCKALGLMEDLKAGIPRTAYHGAVMVRMNGRRVFLAPSYAVDQEITPQGLPAPGLSAARHHR